MRKVVFFISLLGMSTGYLFSQSSLEEVRKLYYQSVEDSEAADRFLESMESCTQLDQGVFLAYKGSAEALISKHGFFPIKKLDWLKKAESTFAAAIQLDPTNAEIRFQRFCVQHYIPKFLGLSKNLDDDRKVIVDFLGDTKSLDDDPVLKKNIAQFLIDSERCMPEETEKLEKLILITAVY